MKIKVGKTYLNRYGETVFIEGKYNQDDHSHPYYDTLGHTYKADGSYFYDHEPSGWDLIGEKWELP